MLHTLISYESFCIAFGVLWIAAASSPVVVKYLSKPLFLLAFLALRFHGPKYYSRPKPITSDFIKENESLMEKITRAIFCIVGIMFTIMGLLGFAFKFGFIKF